MLRALGDEAMRLLVGLASVALVLGVIAGCTGTDTHTATSKTNTDGGAKGGAAGGGGTTAAGGASSGGGSGGSSGTGAAGAGGAGAMGSACDNPNLVWKTANKTNYTSYPDPNSPE